MQRYQRTWGPGKEKMIRYQYCNIIGDGTGSKRDWQLLNNALNLQGTCSAVRENWAQNLALPLHF